MNELSACVMKVLAANILKMMLGFILPSGRIGKSAQRGMGIVILLLTVEAVSSMLNGL